MIAKPNASIPDASIRECRGVVARKSADNGSRKILLPRRPGEPKFAPRQYYYSASRSGVVPSGGSRHSDLVGAGRGRPDGCLFGDL
jgi:hypothetical protein